MAKPVHIEKAILESVARGSRDDWFPFTVAGLTNWVSEALGGIPSHNELLDAVTSLLQRDLLSAKKFVGASFVPFDLARRSEPAYTAFYFGKYDFQLRVTHEGRRFLDGSATVPVPEAAIELDDLLPLQRRKGFDSDIEKLTVDTSAQRQPLALIMFDLDHFKDVNDQYGHPAGDEVLHGVADLVRSRVEGKGRAYRYGGEEFAVLLPNYTTDEARLLAELIRTDVERAELTNRGLRITISAGVAALPEHAANSGGLVECADQALYQAKHLGRNLVRVRGDPDAVPKAARGVKRKQPSPEGLSDDQRERIRADCSAGISARCPKDGALLRVREAHEVRFKGATFLVACPQCGLTDVLEPPV